MKLVGALLRTTRGRLLAGLVVAVLAWEAWLTVDAPRKISPELLAAGGSKVNILVTLPFPPERFHVLAFQRYGRVSGTLDNSIEVRGVKTADLTAVARPYWVTKVEPLPNEGKPS